MHSLRPALESRRKAYGATMTPDQCVEMINYVIYHDPIGGFALGEKTTGSYGTRSDGRRCSVDGLIWKLDKSFVDGIADAGGSSRPAWQVRKVGDINPETGKPYQPFPGALVAAIDPGGSPPPPDPPPPSTDLEARVAALEATVQSLAVRCARIEDVNRAQDVKITELQQTPPGPTPGAYKLVADPNAEPVSTGRTLAHGHELRASVVPK